MSWKEIKGRIEQIIRRERGDQAVIIRIVSENDKVISIILELEDKKTNSRIELNINEWNDLLGFFNKINSIITTPETHKKEEIVETQPISIETSPSTVIIEESPIETPEPITNTPDVEDTDSAVTLLHKTMPKSPKPVIETPLPKPIKSPTPEAVVIEHIKPPDKVDVETVKPPTPPIIATETVEEPVVPQAVVIEEYKPSSVPPIEVTEQEIPVVPEVSEMPEIPEISEPIVSESPSEKPEEVYPPMPPEVQEIFEELDTQAIELEKTLIEAGVETEGDELKKELKITSAMQEVAELMPTGPAKDFVEQMIVKRKETQAPLIKADGANDEDITLVVENKGEDEAKKKNHNNQLKYW